MVKNLPIIPPLPERDGPYDPNPYVAQCGECGRKIRQMEHYSCMNDRCPVQRKVTY